MLVLKSTEYGKLWYEWVQKTIELYGQTWVHSISANLLNQSSPENVAELQRRLKVKIRLFELADKEPLSISPSVNGKHMNAIFCDIQNKYWEKSQNPKEVLEISYSIFMSSLEEGLITLAEHQLHNVT